MLSLSNRDIITLVEIFRYRQSKQEKDVIAKFFELIYLANYSNI